MMRPNQDPVSDSAPVDSLIYSTERALAEHGAKLSEGDRAAVEQALNEAREAVKGEDLERVRRAQDSLTRAVQPLTRAVYEQGPPPGGNGAPSQGAGGDVVDAEFKDVSDRKD